MQLFDVYSLYDLEPTHALGTKVYAKDGRSITDFYGGHAVISIGHSHPHFVDRVGDQLKKLAFYSNSVINPLQGEYAEKLGLLAGLPEYDLFLCNSGAEANENALKLASFVTGRRQIIAFKNAFHGRTSAAVNATDSDKIKAPINRGYPVSFLDMGDLTTVEAVLKQGEVAAVIIEGIQGIGGIYVPDDEFLRQLAILCQQYGALLILDEIQSGFGRSGRFFAHQYSGVKPDIISMAKGMGNGFPIGGILIHPDIKPKKGMLGTTFGGNHLACAAGLAVLEVIEAEGLVEKAAQTGQFLQSALRKKPYFTEVRGRGLMIGLQLDFPAAPKRKAMLFEQGVFTGSAKDPNTIRLLPPLNVSQQDCEQLLQAFDTVMDQPVPLGKSLLS